MDSLIKTLASDDAFNLLLAFFAGLFVYHQYNMPKIQESLKALIEEKDRTIALQNDLIRRLGGQTQSLRDDLRRPQD